MVQQVTTQVVEVVVDSDKEVVEAEAAVAIDAVAVVDSTVVEIAATEDVSIHFSIIHPVY